MVLELPFSRFLQVWLFVKIFSIFFLFNESCARFASIFHNLQVSRDSFHPHFMWYSFSLKNEKRRFVSQLYNIFWSLIMHYYITWLWIEFLHIAFNICIFNLGKWEKWLSNHCASIEVHMALIRGNNWTMLFNARSYPVLHFCLIFICRWEEVQNIILVFFEYCSLFTNRCHVVSHNWITNIVNKYLN